MQSYIHLYKPYISKGNIVNCKLIFCLKWPCWSIVVIEKWKWYSIDGCKHWLHVIHHQNEEGNKDHINTFIHCHNVFIEVEPTIVFQNLASAKITPHRKSLIVRLLTFHVCIKAMDFANANTYTSFSKEH